jgi:V/A-type H+-transporting ATPase subunit F
MNRKIVFITEKDAQYGFELAGFRQYECEETELPELLGEITRENEFGLYVIDERLVHDENEKIIREMEKNSDLVFVIMPPPFKAVTKREDYAARLLRKAIGYHVKLNI